LESPAKRSYTPLYTPKRREGSFLVGIFTPYGVLHYQAEPLVFTLIQGVETQKTGREYQSEDAFIRRSLKIVMSLGQEWVAKVLFFYIIFTLYVFTSHT
jgi:hypothetical protein